MPPISILQNRPNLVWKRRRPLNHFIFSLLLLFPGTTADLKDDLISRWRKKRNSKDQARKEAGTNKSSVLYLRSSNDFIIRVNFASQHNAEKEENIFSSKKSSKSSSQVKKRTKNKCLQSEAAFERKKRTKKLTNQSGQHHFFPGHTKPPKKYQKTMCTFFPGWLACRAICSQT